MTDGDPNYGLLTEFSGVGVSRNPALERDLPVNIARTWLAKGWRDLWTRPALSLGYGLVITAISLLTIWFLFRMEWDYILFPALAGFMIVAPILAIGLYEKSRIIEAGGKPTLASMLHVRPKSGKQIFFAGLMLCLLMLLWNRVAVLLYALFFGVHPFPGIDNIVHTITSTPEGIGLVIVGMAVGALFAAFAFAISVFAIPMMLDRDVDALTAMGTSLSMVWNNLAPMLAWGCTVFALFVLSVATGLLGLIVVFPLLGHATWHAYRSMK